MAVTLTCGTFPHPSPLAILAESCGVVCLPLMEQLEARWLASAGTHMPTAAYFGSTLTAAERTNAHAVIHPLRRRHRAPAPPNWVGPIHAGPIHAGPVHPTPRPVAPVPPTPPVNPAPPPTNPAPPTPPVNPAPPPTNPAPPGPITPPGGNVGTTLGVLGDGTPDYFYDPNTGDVQFVSDGLPHQVELLNAYSASGLFLTSTPTAFTELFGSAITEVDLGRILPANLTQGQLLSDLTLNYSWNGQGLHPWWSVADLIIGAPPPASPVPPPVNPPPPRTPPGGVVGTTLGVLGDGIPDYIYDPNSGDLHFVSDGLPHTIGVIDAFSASSQFLTSNPAEIMEFVPSGIADADLGPVLPAHLTQNQLLSDLTLHYTWNGQGLPFWSEADLIIAS